MQFLAFKLHCMIKDTTDPEEMKIIGDLFKQLYCNPLITPQLILECFGVLSNNCCNDLAMQLGERILEVI